MEKLRKDVFRCNGTLDVPSARSLILVHPWYKGENAFYSLARFEGLLPREKGEYPSNLEKLIVGSSLRNVILFEENPESNVNMICDKVAKMRKSDVGLYAVSTKDDQSSPEYSSWAEVLEVLPDFSAGVDIAGGAVYCATGGCAGGVYCEFKRKNRIDAKFVEDCCFC